MNRKGFIISTFFILLIAMSAAGHPLGNFSINQFARIEVGSSQLNIRQVLDIAEIPTFKELTAIDTNADGKYSAEELDAYANRISAQFFANVELVVDGQTLPLNVAHARAELRPGAGDLSILRVIWDLTAEIPAGVTSGNVKYANKNYTERIGWNEVVVQSASGTTVYDSTAYGSAVTDELLTYPADSLASPLAERSAAFSFTRDAIPANAKLLQNRDGKVTAVVQKDSFAELISVREITPWVAFLGILAAFGLGAFHAMSPGHGKTVVGAYLVGSKGTMKHAAFLGLTVTVTHTLGVFILGLITLFASNYILPERLIPALSFISGVLVLIIGLNLFKNRLFAWMGWRVGSGHQHDHAEDAQNTHDHTADGHTHSHGGAEHTHLPPAQVSWRSLLALGISGGLLPCPSALVLMLAAISANRVGYGLILTLVFSFGLAATLTGFGLAFLYMGRIFDRPSLSESRWIKALPVFSAFVITCLGAAICYTSFA